MNWWYWVIPRTSDGRVFHKMDPRAVGRSWPALEADLGTRRPKLRCARVVRVLGCSRRACSALLARPFEQRQIINKGLLLVELFDAIQLQTSKQRLGACARWQAEYGI